jgi:arginine transport system substrate-binding protein
MNKKLKIIATLITIPLIIILMYFMISSKSSIKKELVVGTNSGFPPYEYIDETGNIVGFDIDLAKEIAKNMNTTVRIEDLSFDALILSLNQGKVDLAIAGISITPNRLEKINMIHYLGEELTTLPLGFWEEIPKEIKTIEDFKTFPYKTISAQAGNIQEEFISKFDFINVLSLDTYSDLIMSIRYKKAIACVLEPLVVENLKKIYPSIKVLDVPLGNEDKNLGNGIGIKKENFKLTNQIQQIINKLKQDGTIKKLNDKWFKNK